MTQLKAIYLTIVIALTCGIICNAETGQRLYEQNCMQCHGINGKGDGPAGIYMNPKPRNFTKDQFKQGDSLISIEHTITNGIPNGGMPSFKWLNGFDLEQLAKYVKAFQRR